MITPVSGYASLTQETEKENTAADQAGEIRSKATAQIWHSRISWRITLTVFLTIMAVQATVLALTVENHRLEQLDKLHETGRVALAPVIKDPPASMDPAMRYLNPPFTAETEDSIIKLTPIDGMAIYSIDFRLIKYSGDPVVTTITKDDDAYKTFLTADTTAYEVVYKPSELNNKPYYIVAKLDARDARDQVTFYVNRSIMIMMLLSAFVTTVLMIALGKWLLEPILFLRDNLRAATANPEAPQIQRSPFNDKDEIGRAILLAQDLIKLNAKNIKQIKTAAQSQIHKLAYYDTLTSLPNRTLFIQKLAEHVKTTSTSDANTVTRLAVVAVDLDHFKDVNDSMGHNVGDAILRAVGKRLRASLPESAVIARTGEDEFAITMPLIGDATTAKDVGLRVQGIIRSEPFKVFNEHFQIRASIGLAVFPDDALDPDQVLKNADIALNRAKEDGRDCIREYLEDFDKAVQARFQMLRDLRDALEHDQLSLNFQPQLDLATGQVIGAEALLRWWKPDGSKEGGKFIPPNEFIPVAEQSGLIVPIGEWVMLRACEIAHTWHEAGYPIRIAVNVSGAQFHQSDIVSFTRAVLAETKLPAHSLELEVTESTFMDDINQTIATLQRLHALGIELAIDDFGTGYSSLSYLRQFPIDRLKIDQSFIRNALNNPDDAAIAKTIVKLGHSLNLKVIAEGVETKEHENFLLQEECDEVQGYRYSRPVPPEKFMDFLKSYNGDLNIFDNK